MDARPLPALQATREAGERSETTAHRRLGNRGVTAPAELGQRLVGVAQAKLRDLAQWRRKLCQPIGALQKLDDLPLCCRRLRGALEVRGFGVHQTMDAVLRFAQRPNVFEME